VVIVLLSQRLQVGILFLERLANESIFFSPKRPLASVRAISPHMKHTSTTVDVVPGVNLKARAGSNMQADGVQDVQS
jgi:hypothetical protein